MIDNAKRMAVVFEAGPESAHFTVKLFLADMAKRGVAEIVGERQGLSKFFVESQGTSHCAGYLRDFDRVCQAIAEVVGKAGCENLRLAFHPPESARMNDPVAVAL